MSERRLKKHTNRPSVKTMVSGRVATSEGVPYCNVQADVPERDDFEGLDAILYTEAVLDSAILDTYPDLRRMSKRDQLILCGRAFGLSFEAIGEAVGLSRQGVLHVVTKQDPERKIEMSKDAKRAYVARMVEARAMDAVRAITGEKLKESSARELSQIAKNLSALGESTKGHEGRRIPAGRMDSLLAELDRERNMGIADVEEVEEGGLRGLLG